MGNEFSVLTPAEVSTILKVPEEAVFAALEAGQLKGFRIGNEWRTTYEFVREMVSSPTNIPSAAFVSASSHLASVSSTVPPEKEDTLVKGVPRLEQFKQMSWQEIDSFSYQWPHDAHEEANKSLEPYEKAYEGAISIEGKETPFVIGIGKRAAAGMDDRARLVVFKGKIGKTLYPLVEFVGANDFATSGKMVSVIRREGRKPVRPSEPIPIAYEGMPTGIYNHVVIGPRSWNVRAVVANATDFSVMIRHAVLRTMRLG